MSRSVVLGLADWIEATRCGDGYGGPVVHWWRDCLLDCRAGHDWRYEGIIAGYLELHAASGDPAWLARARRAGDALVAAQLPDGRFRQSRFELNPGTGGTPHEAAAATGLLRLARALRETDPAAAHAYVEAARSQVEQRLIGELWSPGQRALVDDPASGSFVPNKACTAIEALVLLAEATGDDRYVVAHALPTADAVLRLQVRRPGSRLDGAIAQNTLGGRVVAKYFPYYAARCVSGLLALRRFAGDVRLAEAALAAGRFVARCQEPDGGFPQVLYEDGRVNRFPRWVAAVGDVLRALDELRPLGLELDDSSSREWLTSGILPNGAVMTARGFAGHARAGPPLGPPDLRDFLPVVGWADKAFRYLARGLGEAAPAPPPQLGSFETECTFDGRRLRLRLDGAAVEARQGGEVVYRWAPGDAWPTVVTPWMAAR